MAEKKQTIFILVPELNKSVFKGGVIVSQDHAVIEGGQLVTAEQTDRVDPDGFGMYRWRNDHPNHKRRLKALEMFMEKKNKGKIPFIIGPCGSIEEATKKMHDVRPKAPAEEVTSLKAENALKDTELADLREKLRVATAKK